MNLDTLKGEWKQWKGAAQQKWGELTNDELDQAHGDREQLAGLLQEKYGMAKDEADKEVDSWIASLS